MDTLHYGLNKEQSFIHSVREDDLISHLDSPATTEAEVLLLLKRRNLSPRVIEEIASRQQWLGNYQVKLAIVKNVRTPLKISLGLHKFLFLFDLVTISLMPALARELKDLAENTILSQLPKLPLGETVTLARRASERVAGQLLSSQKDRVIQAAIDNPRVTESTIVRALNHPASTLQLVNFVSEHRKWQYVYGVRMALLRSSYLTTAKALKFINEMKKTDLQELAEDRRVQVQLRKYLKNFLGTPGRPPARSR